jgi:hypothetical protein
MNPNRHMSHWPREEEPVPPLTSPYKQRTPSLRRWRQVSRVAPWQEAPGAHTYSQTEATWNDIILYLLLGRKSHLSTSNKNSHLQSNTQATLHLQEAIVRYRFGLKHRNPRTLRIWTLRMTTDASCYVSKTVIQWDRVISKSILSGCWVRQNPVPKHVWTCWNLRLLELQTKRVSRTFPSSDGRSLCPRSTVDETWVTGIWSSG